MASSNFRVKNGAEITEVLYVSGASSLRNVGVLGPVDPDVAGITVHGDISATGSIFVAGSAVGGSSSSSSFASGAGGTSNELQYNNSGLLDGAGGLNYNETLEGLGIGVIANEKLTVGGNVSATGNIVTNGNVTVDGTVDGRDIAGDAANVVSNSASWSSVYTSLCSNSANYDNTFSTLKANSAEYESVYSTTKTYSADWNYVAANSAGFDGDTTIDGRLTVGSDSVLTDNQLTVVGSISALGTIYAAGSAIGGAGTGGTPAGANKSFQYNDSTALNGGDMFYDETNTSVGIGTSTPNVKLAVVGAISSTNVVYTSSSNSTNWDDTYKQVSDSTTDLAVDTNTLYVDKSENKVGIGTSSPNKELTVIGGISSQDIFIGDVSPVITIKDTDSFGDTQLGYIQFTDTNDQVKGSIGFTNASDRNLRFTNNTEGDVRFLTNSAVSVAITSAGNVGIGTTNPSKALTVVGDISASGSITVANNSYDFADGTSFSSQSLTDIKSTSSTWDSAYTSLKANSAEYESVYATVQATSSEWADNDADIAVIAAASADWNSTYTTLNANTAKYESAYTTLNNNSARYTQTAGSLETNVAPNTADWNYTAANSAITLETSSHDYLSISDREITLGEIDISDDTNLAVGDGITLTGDTLSIDSVSASNFTAAYNHSRGSVTDHSDVSNAGSGQIITATERTDFGNTKTTLDTYSADWNYVAANSALTLDNVTGNGSTTSNNITVGDATVTGDLTVQGSTIQADTVVTVTSALSVTNTGTGPALHVEQTGNNKVVEFLDDGTSVFSVANGGDITVKSGATIDGRDISVDGTNLDSTKTTLNTYSADWNNTKTTLNDNSGRWDTNANTEIAANSADWNYTAANSAAHANEFSFKTITLSANRAGAAIGADIVADTTTDTLTLCAGPNIELISDPTNDVITISGSVGGGGGGGGGSSDLSELAAASADWNYTAANSAITLETSSHDYLSISNREITLGQIDISDDTNLTAGDGITLTGDTLSIDSVSASNFTAAYDHSRGNVTDHADVSNAGSGAIITTDERDKFTRTWTNVSTSSADWNYTAANTAISVAFDVTNSGSGAYRFNNGGFTNDDNPTLHLQRGKTYRFRVNASGHPFLIKTQAGTGTSNQYLSGVSGAGTAVGNVDFEVRHDAPRQLFYQCQAHSGMVGAIHIGDATATTEVFNNSANWNQSYITSNNNFSTLNSNSGRWDTNANTEIAANSADWNYTATNSAITLETSSHDYLSISDREITLNQIDISDDTNLTANNGITLTGDTLSIDSVSASNFTDAYDHSRGSVTDHTDVSNAGSGQIITSEERDKFTRTWTNVSTSSADWNYTAANSALTLDDVTGNGNTTSNNITVGDATITGDLTVQGSTIQADTVVTVTSALSVTNTGTGPALHVEQTGNNKVVEFLDDGTSVFSIANGGNITVKSGATIDGRDLSVDGTNLDSTKTTVDTYSADWNYTAANSAITLETSSHDYLSISDREITLGQVDISDDTNLAANNGITLTGDTLSINSVSATNFTAAYDHSRGNVTDHADVSNAGSGQIITTDERDKFTRTWTNVSTSSADWNYTAANSAAHANEFSFKTITLSGNRAGAATGADIVADTTTDTLTLCAGPNIELISDPATDVITISGSIGGGSGSTFNSSELAAASADWNYTATNSAITLDTSSHNYLSISDREITLGEVDISDDTNLAANNGVTLTGDTLSIDSVSASNFTAAYDHSRGNVTDHADVSNAGSGQIITTDERDKFTRTWTNVSTSSADWNYTAANSALTLETSSHDYLSISDREITLGQVDISDDTNLAANNGITLTGDTLSIDSVSASNFTDAYDHSRGSVTDHSDVSNAGSGQIITATERTDFGNTKTTLNTYSADWTYVADNSALTLDDVTSNGSTTTNNIQVGTATITDDLTVKSGANALFTVDNSLSSVVYGTAPFNTPSEFVVGHPDGGANVPKLRLAGTTQGGPGTYGQIWFSSRTPAYSAYGAVIEGTSENVGVNVGTLIFKVGYGTVPAEKMRVDSNGNVGINQSNPSYQLDVVGSAKISGNIIVNGTVDGRDVATDGTNLDNTKTTLNTYSADWNYTAANSAITLETSSHDYLSISDREITLGEIDISDDTNLAANNGVTLTGDTLSIDSVSATNFTAAYDHSRGSVTDHSDVSNAGSGQIITSTERNNLNSVVSTTKTYSADWNYVAANSGLTLDDVTSNGSTTTNNIQVGDATITGNLTVQGDTIQADTVVTVTSALSVTNVGTGPALHVEQTGNNVVAQYFDDGTPVFRIANGGAIDVGTWNGTAIANAYVADLPTSKITSGTFADARIASSNVTQHQGDITGTGALNSGSITSGFGSIDNGSSSLTTGAIVAQQLRVTTTTAPTNYTSSGTKGDIAYDDNYLYICVSNNNWRRVAIAAW